jgi:hypothetical protein
MSPTPLALEGAQAIQTALDLLGPNGDRWEGGNGHKNAAFTTDPSRGGFDYCLIGALIAGSTTHDVYYTAYSAVKQVIGGSVARYNNRNTTTFPDVQLVLRRAANNLRES